MAVVVPQIDFSPLGQLGQVYRTNKLQAGRQTLLSQLGKQGDYGAIAGGLYGIGDVEGGMQFSKLADAKAERAADNARAAAGLVPSSVREYQFAKGQDFNGSFQDWQTETTKKDPTFTNISSFRKEYSDTPGVKKYTESESIFGSMMKSAKIDNPAGDLDIIYGVAKLMDPESVVREGEFATVAKSAAIPERIKGQIAYVTEGKGRLTPQARKELLDIARNRMLSYREQALETNKRYKATAEQFGIDPRAVIQGFPEPEEYIIAPPAKRGVNPQTGDTVELVNGKWTPVK